MISSLTAFAPIYTLSHSFPSDAARAGWLEYVLLDFATGELSIDDARDLILKTQ